MAGKDLKHKLQNIDESLRQKYMKVILSLSTDELGKVKVNKYKYKSMVKSEILELIPEASDEQADETAQYISNLLTNEAQREKTRRLTKQDKPKTRRSKQITDKNIEITCGHEQHEVAQIDLTNESVQQCELSDTFVRDLKNTLPDANDSLNSTVTASQLDNTYENNLDDSITEQKTIAHDKDKEKHKNNKGQRKKKDKQTIQPEPTTNSDIVQCDDDVISCINECALPDSDSGSVRCNLCMKWFHTQCVGITDLNVIVTWVCGTCRVLPHTVNQLQSQIDILLDTTKTFLHSFNTFQDRMESKYEGLNDRLTAISNQNKTCQQVTTNTLSTITKEIDSVKTDLNKKTNAIMSKSQTLIETVQTTADLVGKASTGALAVGINSNSCQYECNNKTNNDASNGKSKDKPNQSDEPRPKSPDQIQSSHIHTEINNKHIGPTQNKSQERQTTKQSPKRDLTFVTGSCLLKAIDRKFLDENVRVKSYQNAKIEDLQESLSSMDLSRYKNIIIHVGGFDVDDSIGQTSFSEKYDSLLKSLENSGCKVFVSGLLPRGGTDMKPFNDTLKNLSLKHKVTFINNHNSFIMASGELPFDFFHADQVNLKFSGIRKLVQNINEKCSILPKRQNPIHTRNVSQGRVQRYNTSRPRGGRKQ